MWPKLFSLRIPIIRAYRSLWFLPGHDCCSQLEEPCLVQSPGTLPSLGPAVPRLWVKWCHHSDLPAVCLGEGRTRLPTVWTLPTRLRCAPPASPGDWPSGGPQPTRRCSARSARNLGTRHHHFRNRLRSSLENTSSDACGSGPRGRLRRILTGARPWETQASSAAWPTSCHSLSCHVGPWLSTSREMS